MWFLKQYEELYLRERFLLIKYTLPKIIARSETKGFDRQQIAHMMRCLESQVHTLRMTMNVNRVFKLVDTCAAEFKSKTPYYYSTFEAEIEKRTEHVM
jgi:carbamoyl-phosphate synthase large subunit